MRIKAKRFISLCLAVAIIATSVGYGPPVVRAEYMLYIELEEEASIATPSEAVRPGDKATPSEAIPPEEKATPSEAERKFIRVEPDAEDILEYYQKASNAGRSFWKFDDRYGDEHYRDFGFVQGEAEFPLWYEANNQGRVEDYLSINSDEEYYDLAPYVYESISPTKSNWSELSKRLLYDEDSIFLFDRHEIIGFTNWDSSNYTIWSVGGLKEENFEEEGLNEDLGLFFFGKIRNDHDSVEQWYFADKDGKIRSMQTIQPRMMALAAFDGGLLFYFDGKYNNTSKGPHFTKQINVYTEDENTSFTLWNPGGLSGYTFVGWSTNVIYTNTGEGDPRQYPERYGSIANGGFFPPSSSIKWKVTTFVSTLTGVWKPNDCYHLRLVSSTPSYYDGYNDERIIIRKGGETLDLSTYTAEKNGYEFAGWYTEKEGRGTKVESVTFNSNDILYAYFVPNINTVKFFDWDGTLLKEEKVPSGNAATAPELAKREGYLFTGWSGYFSNVTTDINVTANYGKSCVITFNGNEGTVYDQNVYSKEVLSDVYYDLTEIGNNAKRTGYGFIGWYSDPEGGSRYISLKSSENMTVYAHWSQTKNNVVFYRNYPSGDKASYKTKSVFYGDAIGEFPAPNPIGKGLRVKGWYLNPSGTGDPVTPEYIMGASGLPLYAQWESFDVTYHLFYNVDGEIPSGWPTEVTAISTTMGADLVKANRIRPVTISDPIKKEGHFPGAWQADGISIESSALGWYPDKEEVNIYLYWFGKQINTSFYYNRFPTDTFRTTSLNQPDPAYPRYGAYFVKFPDVSSDGPEGKTFIGWYTNREGKDGKWLQLYEPLKPIDNTTGTSLSMDFYAQWANEYSKITYKDYDGSVLNEQTVKYGDPIITPQNPIRPGYKFIGWDKELGNYNNVLEDTEVIAQYEADAFRLTLLSNGGTYKDTGESSRYYDFSANMEEDGSVNSAMVEAKGQLDNKYHAFAGWYTLPVGGVKVDGINRLTEDKTLYAHWDRSSSEVIYQDWDGKELDRQEVAIGENAIPPADPTRQGYTFTKWDKPSTNIQDHIVITAQYKINGYKLTLDGNGGMIGENASKDQVVTYGDSFDQILADGATEARQKHYTFAGWYTEKAGGTKYAGSGNIMPASNVTVYAHWTRISNEVIYKDWDGSIIDRQEIAIGENATPPADPSRMGYTFTGWDKESTNIQANTTITAQYSKNSYKLTLDGNGGTLAGKNTREKQLAYGDSFDQILTEGAAEASQKYYTFTGWYTDKTGGSKYPGSGNTMPASNVMVYAHWIRTSNEVVYKDWDEKIIDRQEISIGEDATPPADPSRTGYTFTGWDKESTNIRVNTTITAQYSKNSYKLTLDGNGGTLNGKDTREQMLAFGDSFDQILEDAATEASQKYYTFTGWYTNKTGGSKYPGNGNTMPASNVTVYAHWTRTSNEVIYQDWDGKIIDRQDVVIGGNATPPVNPSRMGYTFTGWDKESTNIRANTTITAQYSKNSYKLTLDGNGGTLNGKDTREQQLAYRDSFDQILTNGKNEVNLSGYTFDGWYTSPTGGNKYTYSGNQMPALDITVYAHWKEKSYTVNFDPDHEKWIGGVIQRIYTSGTELGSLPAPEIYGLEFLGWWTGRNGIGERITENTKTGTQDVTYYGNWKIMQCIIHFDKNLSAIEKNPEDKIVTYGEVVGSLPVINAEGYTFLGWYTDPTGGEKVIGTTPASLGETIYYAHWDTVPKPTEPEPSKPESRDEEEIITVPVPPSIDSNSKPTVPDTGGKFEVNPDNPYDVTYTKPDGTSARDEWVGDGMDWYHVDEAGKLSYDWYLEGENTWYKLNKEPGDKFGAALTSWNHESMDSKWYFFDPATTKMLTGWQKIDGKWFYFTKQNEAQTYYGSNHDKWIYDPSKPGKPYGSMYRNERTPDGYLVDEYGVLIN